MSYLAWAECVRSKRALLEWLEVIEPKRHPKSAGDVWAETNGNEMDVIRPSLYAKMQQKCMHQIQECDSGAMKKYNSECCNKPSLEF
ncbi:hypothetical protein SDJN02_19835, partial [Cucurbita argyrosperma subsp. argyrosperma]